MMSVASVSLFKITDQNHVLVSAPRASARERPSRDQAKSKMRPALNSVNWRGSPPSIGCAQMLEASYDPLL